jgi:hypothetical protein
MGVELVAIDIVQRMYIRGASLSRVAAIGTMEVGPSLWITSHIGRSQMPSMIHGGVENDCVSCVCWHAMQPTSCRRAL